MLVFSKIGWEIEREAYAEELLQTFKRLLEDKDYSFVQELQDRRTSSCSSVKAERREGQHVFVVAVNKRVVPLAAAASYADPVAEAEAITAERCLLYVALTRAQESAYIYKLWDPV